MKNRGQMAKIRRIFCYVISLIDIVQLHSFSTVDSNLMIHEVWVKVIHTRNALNLKLKDIPVLC